MEDHTYNDELEVYLLAAPLSLAGVETMKMWSVVLEEIKTPLAFYRAKHRVVAKAMSDLWALGKEVDGMSVASALTQITWVDALAAIKELENSGKAQFKFRDDVHMPDSALMHMGGYNFIGGIAEFTASRKFDVVRNNARSLYDHYKQRLVITTLKTALDKLESPSGRVSVRPVVEAVNDSLLRIVGDRGGTHTMAEAFAKMVDRHNMIRDTVKSPLPCWPLKALEAVCPMRFGTLVTLAATNGGGKTSLALQTATATALKLGTEACVGIVSREMASEDLVQILACREAGIDSHLADRGELSEAQMGELQRAVDAIGGNRIIMCDSMEKLTHQAVCSWARQQHTKSNGAMKLLIVDHIGCLDPDNPRKSDYEKITEATRAFKVLANDLRIIVLILCQINRAGQRKAEVGGKGMAAAYGAEDFSLADLKGSGSLGDDSDQVVFICRQHEAEMAQAPVKIKVAKNRWGAKHNGIDATFDRARGQKFVAKAVDEDSNGLPMPYNSFPLKHSTDAKNSRDERMKSEPKKTEDLFG